jgi:hypothetical protein
MQALATAGKVRIRGRRQGGADLIHNAADALAAIPLGPAFRLSRNPFAARPL